MRKEHTLSTASAYTTGIVSLLLMLVMLPASVAMAGAGNQIPSSLTHTGLLANAKVNPDMELKHFRIIKPVGGKTYRNQFPVHIRVPAGLPGNPTITLKLLCRPLKKELLKKRSYIPNSTLLNMPLYARYKDEVLTTVLAVNIRNQVFRGAVRFSALEFRVKATIRAGQITMSRTSDWFKLLYDDREYRKDNSSLRNGLGIGIVGQKQTFKAPATVKVQIGHSWNTEFEYVIQYNNCKFGKKYQTIPLKAKIETKNENTKILIFHITKPGCYRIRARTLKPGTKARWSQWKKFTVTDSDISEISGVVNKTLDHRFKRSPLPHSFRNKTINPQPEPPGANPKIR